MKEFDKRFGKDRISQVPAEPGVYRFYAEKDRLVYVGKAKNLRRRLSQYRNAKRCKAQIKMRKILLSSVRLEWETCASETHAEILENQLIQTHRPKWNVAGAFFFLYPLIGLRIEGDQAYFCYTTQPEAFPGFRFHGAFRSRDWSKEGFFAFITLLRFIGHSVPRKALEKDGIVPQTKARGFVYGFRRLPEDWLTMIEEFFCGDSFRAIEELSLLLLDRPDAIRARAEVEDSLKAIRAFWRHEIQTLRKARERSGWTAYPVSQKERDLIFIASRSKAGFQIPQPSSRIQTTESPNP